MQNNEFLEQLNIYRGEIDEIDSEILRLLAKRFAVVQQVGELKSKHGLQGSYIRPAREAIMLRKLLDDALRLGVPQSLVAGLWRLIIGSSTAHESPLNVVHLHDDMQGAFVAAQYFSDCVPQFGANAGDFWNGAHVNAHSIFVLPNDLHHHLWRDMPEHLKVFACLPFVGQKPATHLAVANIIPEPTGDDISLFYDGKKMIEVAGFVQELSAANYYGTYAKHLPIINL
jgi:chorismate mutase